MNRIIKILMERDGLTEQEAQELFNEAKNALFDAVDHGRIMEAEDIALNYFGLEPDYLDDLLY